MREETPVIKGMFVNAHLKALKNAKGAGSLRRLQKQFGKSLKFRAMEYVPVRDEVRILELALALMHPDIPPERRAFEAGRLHFRNFSKTPYGRIIFGSLPRDFKFMLMNAKYIAQHVFIHVNFTSYDQGPCALQVVMENNDYPLDHFRGLFYEWMHYFRLKKPHIQAYAPVPKTFVYKMLWEKEEKK